MTRECQEIRDVLDSYLGGELLVETNHAVLRHLATCAACATEAERRRRTRELFVESLKVELETEPLRHRIGQAIDADRLWWRRTAQWWTAAAILAAIAVSVWYPRRVDAAAYSDSVGDHVACGLATPATARFDPWRASQLLRPPFTELAQTMAKAHGDYELVEAHTCPYHGRQYAHLVFRGAGTTISLFAEQAARGVLPKASVVAPPSHALSGVYATDQDGYHVDAAATRDHQLFVVSDRTGAAQDALANELLQSAATFVRKLER